MVPGQAKQVALELGKGPADQPLGRAPGQLQKPGPVQDKGALEFTGQVFEVKPAQLLQTLQVLLEVAGQVAQVLDQVGIFLDQKRQQGAPDPDPHVLGIEVGGVLGIVQPAFLQVGQDFPPGEEKQGSDGFLADEAHAAQAPEPGTP